MKSTVYKIINLVETFNTVKDGKDHKGLPSKFINIDRAPGSGVPEDLLVHQQGIYRCDNEKDFIISGSAFKDPGYFYVIKDGEGFKPVSNGKRDYWEIDQVMTHPSGIQIADDILVIGNMQFKGNATKWWDDRSDIRFYQINTDENKLSLIPEIKHLEIARRDYGKTASAVGLTRFDDQWILAVLSDTDIDFYSLIGDPKDQKKKFEKISSLQIVEPLRRFQGISLFFDEYKQLYLFGMPNHKSDKDECWLCWFKTSSDDNRYITHIGPTVTQKAYKHFYRNGTGPRFKYGGCVVFEPDSSDAVSGKAVRGQFKVYSVEAHVTDHAIRINEWNKDL